MDGLLVINKPVGPTSHDIVARARRVLGERRIGHTGTLDPMASGVLPLVVGRATRLARFLTASDKSYDATVRLGFATDSGDAQGRVIGPVHDGPFPDRGTIDRALDTFRGTFVQQPPAFSAKKIDGRRSDKLARQASRAPGVPASAPILPEAVAVTTRSLDVLGVADDVVTLRVDCTAGFYVRALAHDLGARLGCGAHLTALCRTRSGDVTLADAVTLADIEAPPDGRGRALAAMVPLARMLPAMLAFVLTEEGTRHAAQGRELGPGDFAGPIPHRDASGGTGSASGPFRLVGPGGILVGLAEASTTPGFLHPAVVLM
jgi:tRNA pseudouridine55 synthase